eukprot:4922965-Pyramimonas_sp.AAC.1
MESPASRRQAKSCPFCRLAASPLPALLLPLLPSLALVPRCTEEGCVRAFLNWLPGLGSLGAS